MRGMRGNSLYFMFSFFCKSITAPKKWSSYLKKNLWRKDAFEW